MEDFKNKIGNTLISVASIFIFISIICFIFHISPNMIFEYLSNFTKHHYFLVGFIFMVLGVLSFRYVYYLNTPEKKTISKNNRIDRRRKFLNRFRKK